MIENIRKYTGLMIIVLALLFIGLVFFDSSASSAFPGQSVMKIGNRAVTHKEYQREAINAQRIPSFFGFYGEGGQLLNRTNSILGAGDPDNLQFTTRYLANRYAVRQAGIDYGVTPDLEEVQKFIREVLFVNLDGTFDQKGYDSFLTNQLGSLGMNSRSLNEILTDLLTANNLIELIGGSLKPDPAAIRSLFEDRAQSLKVKQILIPRSDYMVGLEPSEEEIKAYWEENKGRYLTDERRKVTFVHAEPDWAAALEKVREAAKKAEEKAPASEETAIEEEEEEEEAGAEADALPGAAPAPTESAPAAEAPAAEAPAPAEEQAATAEAPAQPAAEAPAAPKAEEAPAQPQSPREQLTPAQRLEAIKTLNNTVDELWNTVYEAQGADFEAIAKDFGYETKVTEFFT
ncbi:MAG: SurA N-terminal domain-containing protein, partial [Verrucomicrobiales bacterium]